MASLIPQSVLSMVGLTTEMTEPISGLASRFIKTIQKNGIFHAKNALINEASPDQYRKITGESPPWDRYTAGKYKLQKQGDFNHDKVKTDNDMIKTALDSLDPVDKQKIMERIERVQAKEQDRPKRKRPSSSPTSEAKKTKMDDQIGEYLYGKQEDTRVPSPAVSSTVPTPQPTPSAAPIKAVAVTPEQEFPLIDLYSPESQKVQQEFEKMKNTPPPAPSDDNLSVPSTPQQLLVDESKFVANEENLSATGFLKGGLNNIASNLFSTLGSVFPGASTFKNAYDRVTPQSTSEKLGAEFTQDFAQYMSRNLFNGSSAGDQQLNRLAVQDSTHAVSPFVLDLIYNVQPQNQNNQVPLLQLNYLSEQKSMMPFPI